MAREYEACTIAFAYVCGFGRRSRRHSEARPGTSAASSTVDGKVIGQKEAPPGTCSFADLLLREGGAVRKEVVLVLDANPYEHQTLLLLLGRRGGTARVAALQHAVGLPVVP